MDGKGVSWRCMLRSKPRKRRCPLLGLSVRLQPYAAGEIGFLFATRSVGDEAQVYALRPLARTLDDDEFLVGMGRVE